MERFLIVYRGAPGGTSEASRHHPGRWSSWFDAPGAPLIDRGDPTHNSVEVASRPLGPKLSGSPLAGYSLVAASDFNDVVRLAEERPIFDEHGWVEIARLTGAQA